MTQHNALMASSMRAQVGAWPTLETCVVDPTVWGRANQVRVFPGRANIWTLEISTINNPSQLKLKGYARDLMLQWFSDSWIAHKYTGLPDAFIMPNSLTRISVLEVSDKPPGDRYVMGSPRNDTGDKTAYLSQQADNMIPPPQMRKGPTMFVTIEFDYWGDVQDMAWPTWDQKLAGFTRSTHDRFCPLQCDAMLYQSLGGLENLTVAKTDKSAIDQTIKDAVRASSAALSSVGGALKTSLYIAAGVAGLWVAAKVIR